MQAPTYVLIVLKVITFLQVEEVENVRYEVVPLSVALIHLLGQGRDEAE